jgi:hypothetical protein
MPSKLAASGVVAREKQSETTVLLPFLAFEGGKKELRSELTIGIMYTNVASTETLNC